MKVLLLVILLAAVPCQAHELAQNETSILLKSDGTYVVDVKVDPEVLVQRLEVAADQELSEELDSAALQRRIGELDSQLEQNIELRFDGQAVQPQISYLPQSTDRRALWGFLRLEGRRPEAAETLQWRCALLSTSYPLTIRHSGGSHVVTTWVEGSKSSPIIDFSATRPRSSLATFRQYVYLGFTHILPKGLDHILFVLGIFLLSTKLKPVLMQVTAFTIAHSITLALAMYGYVSLPSSVVEPLIALSIVYVAVENIATRTLHSWRVGVVFAFGLLHGMGFAGVLRELGLPRDQFVNALLAFNIGVELGQLAVIALAFVLVASWARRHDWYRHRVVVPASLAIAAVGAFWTVQRVM